MLGVVSSMEAFCMFGKYVSHIHIIAIILLGIIIPLYGGAG